MKKIILVLITLIVSQAFGQADINSKMTLLEQNVQNAENNFQQFKENLNISIKNFNEATRVVNELRRLKQQVVRDTKRAENNALVFGQVKEKYNEFIAGEQAQIMKEQEAIGKLEMLLASIQENIVKRKQIIANYEIEAQKAQGEIDLWREKKREVASVMDDVTSREEGALSEREHWMGKKETYKKETQKWAGELKKTKKTFLTFSKLRD